MSLPAGFCWAAQAATTSCWMYEHEGQPSGWHRVQGTRCSAKRGQQVGLQRNRCAGLLSLMIKPLPASVKLGKTGQSA